MLKEIKIDKWSEFNETIDKIKNDYGFSKVDGCKNELNVYYRGLPSDNYNLSTTLSRYSPKKVYSVLEYAHILKSCSSEIESFTRYNWNLPKDDKWETEYITNLKKYPYAIIKIPFLEFWIYTRHHGFPSPLLDWSASPYIAAFFAFEDQLTKAGNIAIYAYFEPIETSSDSDNPSRIRIIGEPGLRTHERHYLQQSWYTLAYLTDEPNNKHVISDYNNLFLKEEYVFVKIIIPKSQGIQALTYLHEHNINNFSLMHSEESLLKTMAFKLLTI